jgi:hypothetical protein
MIVEVLDITTECANFYKKSANVAWSEKDVSKRISEGMFSRQVTALTGKIYSDDETCDEELEYDDLATAYKDLHARSTEICKMLGEQKKINKQLLSEKNALLTKVSELNVKVTCLNSQIEEFKNQVENGSTIPNNVVDGEGKRQAKGIDFDYQSLNR